MVPMFQRGIWHQHAQQLTYPYSLKVIVFIFALNTPWAIFQHMKLSFVSNLSQITTHQKCFCFFQIIYHLQSLNFTVHVTWRLGSSQTVWLYWLVFLSCSPQGLSRLPTVSEFDSEMFQCISLAKGLRKCFVVCAHDNRPWRGGGETIKDGEYRIQL